MTLPVDTARPHMLDLAGELTKTGAVRTAPWAEAFASTPRHLFVPQWLEQETNDRGITVWRHRHASDEGALAAVYRDVTLVTALDPATAEQVDDTAWTGIPTSSSTLPSLMAGMLEDLAVDDGHKVWEIGTGTGYNAALLCARLGDAFVHSSDVDPELLQTARERLAGLGHRPHLAAGDARGGYPNDIVFDRVIATCSVPSIPAAWIAQTRPGGVIVADVALGIEGGLVQLAVDKEGGAAGAFTTTAGRFMPARGEARTYPTSPRSERAPDAGRRPTTLTAADIRAHYPLRLVLALHLPGVELVYHVDEAGVMALQLQDRDGAWARVPLAGDDTGTVCYGGDGELWRQAEAAWDWWNRAGRPAQDRFGYARDTDGVTQAWYEPDGTRWNLPG
ncbi:methyltransferase domain-containing protein [Streptomyces sp. NPDC088770]|uniref:methyltransferase domain-containing protein n=1 Tax=unclassified Streptomyces TaxID=2593676 RepID=UPI002DD9A4F4|nr:methyltransferase domain-containing protein [Streptomyces sp. NBC_01788]WSB29748.1 methyltransferase domain-containing protein [Streptomyces sp. NBC_01788]